MGSIFSVPLLRRRRAGPVLDELRDRGFRIVAAGLGPDTTPLHRADLGRRSVVLVGSEAHGLSPEVAGEADLVATIPMPAGVDSLSVNAACAVILYQANLNTGRLEEPAGPLKPAY